MTAIQKPYPAIHVHLHSDAKEDEILFVILLINMHTECLDLLQNNQSIAYVIFQI